MIQIPITLKGEQKLRDELKRLKNIERPRVIAAIAEARAHGDLSENAEYDAAREQQGFIEGRIKDVESKLSSARVIDPKTLNANGRVVFGSTVTLLDVDTDKNVTYQIVGDDEADIANNLISVSSPIARGLIGKEQEDEVEVKTPKGIRTFEILNVQYL